MRFRINQNDETDRFFMIDVFYRLFIRKPLKPLVGIIENGKIIKRIMTVFPLRVKDSHSLRKFVFREVMVADDHINALFAGVLDLLVGLDAAVECDDEVEPVFCCPVNAFIGNTVALVISLRDVEIHSGSKASEE